METISLLLLRLPKLPSQHYSNWPSNLGSSKEILNIALERAVDIGRNFLKNHRNPQVCVFLFCIS